MSEQKQTAENLPELQRPNLMDQLAEVSAPDFRELIPFGNVSTSLDRTSKEGRVVLFQHINNEGEDPSQWINKEIGMVDITIMPIRWTDRKTGELISTFRTVIRTDDGKDIDFKSIGVLKSISSIEALLRKAPWKPPLRVTLRQIPTSDGRSMFRLDPVDAEISGPAKRK